jgi:hypothetical protein
MSRQARLARRRGRAQRRSVVDTSRARATGYQPATSYAVGMPALVAAALREVAGRDRRTVYPVFASHPGDQFDYPAEDRLLRELP